MASTTYQMYRSTTLGDALQKTLDELVQAEKLKTYRFCDNVWTFVMEGVEFRDTNKSFDERIDRVKFVACDGSRAAVAGNVPTVK